mgnify:CR=1 FL=1
MTDEIRATPFHSRTAALNRANRWINRNGWTLAADFGDANAEALAARASVIMADITWRWRATIEGAGAGAFLSRLLTKDASRLKPGTASKALWLSDSGGVMGACVIARLGREHFILAASAPDDGWISSAAAHFGATVSDISGESGGIAIAGPFAASALTAAGLPSAIEPLQFREMNWRGLAVAVSRWGEHGGYEIWCKPGEGLIVWDRIAKAGARFGLVPAGLIAADILDLERGVARPGRDYQPAQLADDAQPTPLSLGLELLIDDGHLNFNGRAAWQTARAAEKRRFAGIELDCETPPSKHAALMRGDEPIGRIVASVFSPALRRAIALAQIDESSAAPETEVRIALPTAGAAMRGRVW